MSTPTLENDDQNKENDLFYLVKDISKNSIGLKDSEGNPVAFFDEKDKGVIQSTALLQKLNNLEFTLGSSGSVNSGWHSFLQAGTHTYEDTTGWNPSTFIINWITTTTATDDIGKCRELEVNWATSILNSWEATASKRQGRGLATATFGEIFFLTIKNQLLIANSSLSNLTDFNALKIYIEGILSGSNDHSTLPGSAGRSTIPIKEYFKYFNISDGTQFENPGELSDFVTIINSIYGDTLSDQLDVQRNNLSSFQSISQSVLSFQNNTEFALGPYLKGEDRITGYQNIETEEIVSELPEGSDVTDYNLLYGNFSVIDELKDRFRKYSEFANVQTLISGVMLNNQLIESKDFQSLIDTPTGYLGHSGDYLIINGNETGVHFTGIEKIASDLIDYGFGGGEGSTNFTGLQDTPTGYIGHSGQYLIVNNNETGVHFTGIEKIASDLTDYGFGGGSLDIPKYTNLPDPTENDSKIVASGCDLYYGCDGEWKKIGADDIPPPENIPGCVSNLEEYNQYQEYKERFLADNMGNTAESILNNETRLSDIMLDVCLFPESNLETEKNTVVIDETEYKWGIFDGPQTINLSAVGYSDQRVNCVFREWVSSNVTFEDSTSANTSVFVDTDSSITGSFDCFFPPDQTSCSEILFHLQSNNDQPIDKSTYQRPIENANNVVSSNDQQLFGGSTFDFTSAQGPIVTEVVDISSPEINGFEAITTEVWINLNDLGLSQGSSQTIFEFGGVDRLRINGSTNNPRPIGSLFWERGNSVRWLPADLSPLNTNQWYHIAVVYTESSRTLKVYLDGVQIALIENISFLIIDGRWRVGGPSGFIKGYLQDFRVSKKEVYTSNFIPPNNLLNNPC